MRTISFPAVGSFVRAVDSNRERSAYLDGLAILQEAAGPTESLSPSIDYDEIEQEIAKLARQMPNIGEHLRESEVLVLDALRAPGAINPSASQGTVANSQEAVELHHLRASMKDRFVDLALATTRRPPADSACGNEYDRRQSSREALNRDLSRMRSCGFPDSAIVRTLGLRVLPAQKALAGAAETVETHMPHYPEAPLPVYTHTNSKGLIYYLNDTQVRLRGGRWQTIYFFSRLFDPTNAVALPPNVVVKENPRNGFLTVSKKK